jgi:hypothetical protein
MIRSSCEISDTIRGHGASVLIASVAFMLPSPFLSFVNLIV